MILRVTKMLNRCRITVGFTDSAGRTDFAAERQNGVVSAGSRAMIGEHRYSQSGLAASKFRKYRPAIGFPIFSKLSVNTQPLQVKTLASSRAGKSRRRVWLFALNA